MKKFLLIEILVVVAIIGVLAALFTMPQHAQAQPYYNNSSPTYGAGQYNNSFVQPYQPSLVISNQVKAGIYATVVAAGSVQSVVANTISNNWPAYQFYSQPPAIIAESSLTGTNGCTWVITDTTSNYVIGVTTTNGNNLYIQAIGH